MKSDVRNTGKLKCKLFRYKTGKVAVAVLPTNQGLTANEIVDDHTTPVLQGYEIQLLV